MEPYIEHIFYINLNHRKDRKQLLEYELDFFGLKYERVEAIQNPIGALGCSMSHIKTLKLAKERGYKNILILEDDFTFTVSKETFETNIKNFFGSKIEYEVCCVSYNVQNQEDVKGYDFIKRGLNVQTASGYIVNSSFYDTLIQNFETGLQLYLNTNAHWLYAIDQYWKLLQPSGKWYIFHPRLGKQRESYSDISKQIVNYPDS